jgi:hypothetical protein
VLLLCIMQLLEVAWYTLWDRTCSILYSKDHVRNDMDVDEHERLSNITLKHKLSKGTAYSKKGYGCRWTWETIQHYT